jgi:hypothetical protein
VGASVVANFELAIRILYNANIANPHRDTCDGGDLCRMLSARRAHCLISERDVRGLDLEISTRRCDASEKQLGCCLNPAQFSGKFRSAASLVARSKEYPDDAYFPWWYCFVSAIARSGEEVLRSVLRNPNVING